MNMLEIAEVGTGIYRTERHSKRLRYRPILPTENTYSLVDE